MMEKPVYNALQDLKKTAMFPDPQEMQTLEEVVKVLVAIFLKYLLSSSAASDYFFHHYLKGLILLPTDWNFLPICKGCIKYLFVQVFKKYKG